MIHANTAVDVRATRLALLEYGYDDSTIENIEPIAQRIKNVNFRVSAGGSEMVVKRYAAAGAQERLRGSHEYERFLAARGFPTAALLQTRSGETFTWSGGGWYTVHAWVEGQQIGTSTRDPAVAEHPDLLDGLASAVGTMLKLSRGFEPPHGAIRTVGARIMSQPLALAHSIRTRRRPLLTKANALRLKPRKSEFDRWILRTLPEVFAQADWLASRDVAPWVDAEEAIMVHNDINWENLIFDPDLRLKAVLDFDNAAVVPAALEIGAAAVTLAGPDLSTTGRFVSRVVAAAEIDTDLELVRLGMYLKCVRSILWSIDAYLSDRIGDDVALSAWCSHLHACLRGLRSA